MKNENTTRQGVYFIEKASNGILLGHTSIKPEQSIVALDEDIQKIIGRHIWFDITTFMRTEECNSVNIEIKITKRNRNL